jgi:hypothetical protein
VGDKDAGPSTLSGTAAKLWEYVGKTGPKVTGADVGFDVNDAQPADPAKSRTLPSGTKRVYVAVTFANRPQDKTVAIDVYDRNGKVEIGSGLVLEEDNSRTGEWTVRMARNPRAGKFDDGPYQARVKVDDTVVALINWEIGGSRKQGDEGRTADSSGAGGPGLPERPPREGSPPEESETWVEVKEMGVTKVVMARAPDPSQVTVYGGSLAFALNLDTGLRQEADAPGSFWIIAAGGARWNGQDLLPGRVYRVDDNRRPCLTDGEYAAWVLLGEERDLFAGPDAAGKPLYRVRADERLELLLPAEKNDGVHKVRTGGPRPIEGWIKGGGGLNQGCWKQLLFMHRAGKGRK